MLLHWRVTNFVRSTCMSCFCWRSFNIPYYLHYKPQHMAAGCIYACLQMMQLKPEPEQGWYWWELLPFQIPFQTLDGTSVDSTDLHCKESLERDTMEQANRTVRSCSYMHFAIATCTICSSQFSLQNFTL